jgi:tetratricopeptide (TPR) repeat protein
VTDKIHEAIERAHQELQDVFRANISNVAGACGQARDRLAAIRGFDPEDASSWQAAATLAADLRVLLGFLAETAMPSSEPPEFRALVLAVLRYLYLAEEIRLGSAMAEGIQQRWTTELGRDHPDRITSVERHAACLAEDGGEAALHLFEEAWKLRSRIHGAEHQHTLSAATNLCACLNRFGEYHAALRLSQDTVQTCRRILGEDSDVTLHATARFAESLLGLDEHRTALSVYRDVHERYVRKYSADNLTSLAAAEGVAFALDKAGDIEAARKVNEDILRRYERLLGTKDPFLDGKSRIGRTRDRLSANLRALGHDEARAVYGPVPDF